MAINTSGRYRAGDLGGMSSSCVAVSHGVDTGVCPTRYPREYRGYSRQVCAPLIILLASDRYIVFLLFIWLCRSSDMCEWNIMDSIKRHFFSKIIFWFFSIINHYRWYVCTIKNLRQNNFIKDHSFLKILSNDILLNIFYIVWFLSNISKIHVYICFIIKH